MTRPPDAHQRDQVGAVVLATAVDRTDQPTHPFDPYWAVAGGKPLVAWSVAALAQSLEVDALALVVAPGRLAKAQALIGAESWQAVRLVVSGEDRGLAGALRAGLGALPQSCVWVVVHEAARPLVTPELVAAGLATARQAGASGAAVAVEPVKETIKRVRDGLVVETLDRSRLVLLHTPQVYARAALVAALSSLGPAAAASDTATLALAAGLTLVTYAERTENLMVRAPEDLAVAARLLERRRGGGARADAPAGQRGKG